MKNLIESQVLNFGELAKLHSEKDDFLEAVCKKIFEERKLIIDLFCMTFIVSKEPRSPE